MKKNCIENNEEKCQKKGQKNQKKQQKIQKKIVEKGLKWLNRRKQGKNENGEFIQVSALLFCC